MLFARPARIAMARGALVLGPIPQEAWWRLAPIRSVSEWQSEQSSMVVAGAAAVGLGLQVGPTSVSIFEQQCQGREGVVVFYIDSNIAICTRN